MAGRFVIACALGDLQVAQQLFGQHREVLNMRDSVCYDRKGLMAALHNNRSSVSSWLAWLDNLQLSVSDIYNQTALHYAAWKCSDQKIITRLLTISDQKVINQVDTNGYTALALAVEYNNPGAVECLGRDPRTDWRRQEEHVE